jgi:RNA polymerase sigma-70 factor, ECF subfamily
MVLECTCLSDHQQDRARLEASPQLIARARRNRGAFGEVYDLYLPRVFAFCRKYSATREEAEDLTSLTFERALASIARYEFRDVPFSRWLLRIAANAVIDQARKGDRVTPYPVDLAGIAEDSQLDKWEQAYWLRTHIEALPFDQQEAVRLRFYEDQRFQDVARRMGRSEGAVKQLLRRALRALHLRIQEETEEDSSDE